MIRIVVRQSEIEHFEMMKLAAKIRSEKGLYFVTPQKAATALLSAAVKSWRESDGTKVDIDEADVLAVVGSDRKYYQ